MPAPLPLGVSADDGTSPRVLTDEKAMAEWCRLRSGAGAVTWKQYRDILSRTPPPVPRKQKTDFGVSNLEGSELDNLKRTGWAVLYGAQVSPAIKDQLRPLIDFRREQVDNDKLCRVFDGNNFGYKPGQTVDEWLGLKGVSAGAQVRPSAGVPFYVMIVASPEDISFEFQYRLDVYWGVDRLWLKTPADYGAYARAVIENEKATEALAERRLKFFAPRFEGDDPTAMTCDYLVKPLVDLKMGDDYGFAVDVTTGPDATRDALVELYGLQRSRPAIYFCASHGVLRTPPENPFLPDTMGAILCEKWIAKSIPTENNWMAAHHLKRETDLRGTMHVFFFCYGGGWPKVSFYDGTALAPAPMMAKLPQTILAKGGLAVLAHIDEAWSYSYRSLPGIDRTQEYESVLTRLMKGARAGHATDSFNIRWNYLAGDIAEKTRDQLIEPGADMHNLWIEHDDARSYVLLGDPAARLNVEKMAPVPSIGAAS